jgi:type IV secretion system protein VirD4
MAGYGLKAYLIAQDIRQIVDAYGQNESIVSNCHVRIAFAPNQVETAEMLSKMTGTTTVQKASFNFSGSRFSPVMSHVNASVDHIERPLMTPDEIMRLRPPKKEGSGDSEVITEPGDMLIFVSGHFPILGMQMLYFADPELARRSAIAPPKTTQRQISAGRPVQLDKPELVTDDDATTGLERGFIEELRRP